MKPLEILNLLTGLAGFCAWLWLSHNNPEQSTNIALGGLLILLGFGGRDTIKDILKVWRGTND